MPRTTARSLSELVHRPDRRTNSGRWHFIADTLNTSPTVYGTVDTSFAGFSPDRASTYSSSFYSPGGALPTPSTGSPGGPAYSPPAAHRRRPPSSRGTPGPGPSTAIKDIEPRFSVPRLETYEYTRQELAENLDKLTVKRSLSHFLDHGPRSPAAPAREAREYALSSGQLTPGPLFYGTYGTGGLDSTQLGATWEASAQRKPNPKVEKLIRKMSARCSECGALGHRWHLPSCKLSTDGTGMSVGYVRCYKTR